MHTLSTIATVSFGDVVSYLALVIAFIALIRTRKHQEENAKLLLEEKRTQLIQGYSQRIDRLWGWKGRFDQILLHSRSEKGLNDFIGRDTEKAESLRAAEDLGHRGIGLAIDALKGLSDLTRHESLDAASLEKMLAETTQIEQVGEVEYRLESLYTTVQATLEAYHANKHAIGD